MGGFASVLAFFFSFRTAVKNTRFARTCVNNNKKKKKHARRSISQGLIAHVYAQKKKENKRAHGDSASAFKQAEQPGIVLLLLLLFFLRFTSH